MTPDKPYSDTDLVDDCEDGWRKFCCEVLCRSFGMIQELGRRSFWLSEQSLKRMRRKDIEILRRQVAAFRWVFEGTGGDFGFDLACEMCGRDPYLMRRSIVSAVRPSRDINRVVEMVKRFGRPRRVGPSQQPEADGGVGASIVPAVAALRRKRLGTASRHARQAVADSCGENPDAV